MNYEGGFAGRISAGFPINLVPIAPIEHSVGKGLDGWMEFHFGEGLALRGVGRSVGGPIGWTVAGRIDTRVGLGSRETNLWSIYRRVTRSVGGCVWLLRDRREAHGRAARLRGEPRHGDRNELRAAREYLLSELLVTHPASLPREETRDQKLRQEIAMAQNVWR